MNITAFVEALLALIATVITAFVIPYIKSKTSNEQQDKLKKIITYAVEAAEKVIGNGHGADKFQYVNDFLESIGIDTDKETIKIMIESAVYGLDQVDSENNIIEVTNAAQGRHTYGE